MKSEKEYLQSLCTVASKEKLFRAKFGRIHGYLGSKYEPVIDEAVCTLAKVDSRDYGSYAEAADITKLDVVARR